MDIGDIPSPPRGKESASPPVENPCYSRLNKQYTIYADLERSSMASQGQTTTKSSGRAMGWDGMEEERKKFIAKTTSDFRSGKEKKRRQRFITYTNGDVRVMLRAAAVSFWTGGGDGGKLG